jgi:phospholipase C
MVWITRVLGWILAANIALATESPIKNIVVLVMENRSFDTFLGSLSLDNPTSNVNGLRGHEYNVCQTSGKKIRMRRATSKKSIFDPEHSTKGVNQQLFGILSPEPGSVPTMSGFVDSASYRLSHSMQKVGLEQAAQEVMTYFTEKELPVLYNLTKEYAVIDSWFGMYLLIFYIKH